jgi:AraC family transcriptional regulator
MHRGLEPTVQRVIDAMRDRLSEPFTIDEMSQIAMFSKFHFSRLFQEVTGMPPARYLTAMRLAEAKRLLLTTSLSVVDISVTVGYASLGTFGTRFKYSVGLSPTAFRASRGWRPYPAGSRRYAPGRGGTLRGRVYAPSGAMDGPVFLGVFPDPVFEGTPVRCAELRQLGNFVVDEVPVGKWHIFAYQTGAGGSIGGGPAPAVAPWVGTRGPIAVASPPLPPMAPMQSGVTVPLRARRPVDPPMLGALFAPAISGPVGTCSGSFR